MIQTGRHFLRIPVTRRTPDRRHRRHGEATRAAVKAWGLEIVCEGPSEYSNALTAVFMPSGHDAERFRENFDMSLGAGLSQLATKVFRIGHLGSFNDLMLAGALSGVEMGASVVRCASSARWGLGRS